MSISPPRRANSRPCSRRPAATATPRAISEILEPLHGAARRDRAGSAARSSARAGNPPHRTGGDAIGAHCRFRKRDQRNSGESREPVSTSSFIAAARRAAQAAAAAPPADKAGRGPFKAPPARPRPTRIEQGSEQGAVDHHLQDPLAAGRRERGRDRARHLQDGDDAARQRTPPRRCPRWRVRAIRRLRPSRPLQDSARPAAPAPAMPSMTSPTPIGRQSFNNPAPDATATVAIRVGGDPAGGGDARRRRRYRQATSPAPFRPSRLAPCQPQAHARCRCRRPNGCPRRSADRCCARRR